MRNRVAVVGVGQTEARKDYPDYTYGDLVQWAVRLAFEDCNLTMRDIDAVVFANAPDAFCGINHPERWSVDYIGARGKPFMRSHTGGSTGISAVEVGFYHVASGLFDAVLVAGAEKTTETGDAQEILNKTLHPLYERDLAENAPSVLGASAGRYMHKYGATEEQLARVSLKNHRHGLNNPYAHIQKDVSLEDILRSPYVSWPLRLLECCPSSCAAAALILCSEKMAYKATDTPAWIKGVGHRLETYWVGDRMGPKANYDHADAHALTAACWDAYKMAGITNPRKEIDVAELYCAFPHVDWHSVDSAGFCEMGEAPKLFDQGFFDMDGEVAVTPSGGVQCSNPIAVTAMIRVIEAALQVQHKAGARQVDGAQRALASGCGGTHQSFGVVVLDRNK